MATIIENPPSEKVEKVIEAEPESAAAEADDAELVRSRLVRLDCDLADLRERFADFAQAVDVCSAGSGSEPFATCLARELRREPEPAEEKTQEATA